MIKAEEGYGLMTGVAALTVISALILTITPIFHEYSGRYEERQSEIEAEAFLLDIVNDVLSKLINTDDSNVFSDLSPCLSPFLESEFEAESGVEIELRDISSRINLNTFRDEIINSSEENGRTDGLWRLIFNSPEAMTEIEEERAAGGFYSGLIDLGERIPDLLKEGADEYLTFHGYWNVNVADEKALEDIFVILTEDPAQAESFRNFIREKRMAPEKITDEELMERFPEFSDLFYPIISALPLLNVNILDSKILYSLLSRDFGSRPLPDSESSFNRILSRREVEPISREELPKIIGIKEPDHPIYDYIGTETWFWELDVSDSRGKIICRTAVIPGPGDKGSGSFSSGEKAVSLKLKIIEKRFFPVEKDETS